MPEGEAGHGDWTGQGAAWQGHAGLLSPFPVSLSSWNHILFCVSVPTPRWHRYIPTDCLSHPENSRDRQAEPGAWRSYSADISSRHHFLRRPCEASGTLIAAHFVEGKSRLGNGSALPEGRVALCLFPGPQREGVVRAHAYGLSSLARVLTLCLPCPGCQKTLLLSPEGTVLRSPVRKHDLGPHRITGNRVGLFTHLAGALRKRKVGRTSEEPLRGPGVCVSDGSQQGGGTGEGGGTTWLWRLGIVPLRSRL